MKAIRKCLALGAIIIGGTAIAIPEPGLSKFAVALAVSMNAASLYLLKEEDENGKGKTPANEGQEGT